MTHSLPISVCPSRTAGVDHGVGPDAHVRVYPRSGREHECNTGRFVHAYQAVAQRDGGIRERVPVGDLNQLVLRGSGHRYGAHGSARIVGRSQRGAFAADGEVAAIATTSRKRRHSTFAGA